MAVVVCHGNADEASRVCHNRRLPRMADCFSCTMFLSQKQKCSSMLYSAMSLAIKTLRKKNENIKFCYSYEIHMKTYENVFILKTFLI